MKPRQQTVAEPHCQGVHACFGFPFEEAAGISDYFSGDSILLVPSYPLPSVCFIYAESSYGNEIIEKLTQTVSVSVLLSIFFR